MKKYNLSIFSGSTSIDISVKANNLSIKDNLICFYDKDGNLISAFPVSVTAIISIQNNDKED